MGLLHIIRRLHVRQKPSISAIARLTGSFRNTMSKHPVAVPGGESTRRRMARIKLSHRPSFLLLAHQLQTRDMLFDAPWHRFRVFSAASQDGDM